MSKRELQVNENCIEGRYANFFKIGYNADVFVIDHFQYFPVDSDKPTDSKLNTIPRMRVIMAPADVKLLFKDLGNSIEDYEKKNGVIGK